MVQFLLISDSFLRLQGNRQGRNCLRYGSDSRLWTLERWWNNASIRIDICFIRVKPVVLEQRLSDDFTSGSMRYKPGPGVTAVYFGSNNQAHVALPKVMMVDDPQKPILTLTYNIDATEWY